MRTQPQRANPIRRAGVFLATLAILCAPARGQISAQAQKTEVIVVDATAPAHAFPHFWEQMFGSGRAILSLRESYRRDAREVRQITDFRYVRFHDILDDDVGVYDE
ncbi:MAG TPA: hypothetical protein VKS44_14285, partial [Candidatus Acidoferrales bacterium]|nr:hypothetical protein [Candidatus Acidoferrales bacterium]